MLALCDFICATLEVRSDSALLLLQKVLHSHPSVAAVLFEPLPLAGLGQTSSSGALNMMTWWELEVRFTYSPIP